MRHERPREDAPRSAWQTEPTSRCTRRRADPSYPVASPLWSSAFPTLTPLGAALEQGHDLTGPCCSATASTSRSNEIDRRTALFVAHVDLRPVIEEVLHDLGASCLNGREQRRLPLTLGQRVGPRDACRQARDVRDASIDVRARLPK